MSNEFGGTSYTTQRAMLTAIAETWITAHGTNPVDFAADSFANFTDAELAADCIEGFGLDIVPDSDAAEAHMTREGYNAADLAAAFAAMRGLFCQAAHTAPDARGTAGLPPAASCAPGLRAGPRLGGHRGGDKQCPFTQRMTLITTKSLCGRASSGSTRKPMPAPGSLSRTMNQFKLWRAPLAMRG